MSNDQLSSVLKRYLPVQAVGICTMWIVRLNIHLRITRSRVSKFGDYRPVRGSGGHIITINHNLNQYSFLITFIHEVAHLLCEEKYSRFIAPHGREWKQEYTSLLNYFLSKNIFPSDIEAALHNYARNPAASSCNDENLLRVLRKFDVARGNEVVHLEELPEGTLFRLQASSKIFVKGIMLRKRFQCFEQSSGIEYRVSALAEVTPVAAGGQQVA